MVHQAGTSQVHRKEMVNVPSIYPLGTSQVHSEILMVLSSHFPLASHRQTHTWMPPDDLIQDHYWGLLVNCIISSCSPVFVIIVSSNRAGIAKVVFGLGNTIVSCPPEDLQR